MKVYFKKTFAAVLISTVSVVCGAGIETSISSIDGSALTHQSIAAGLIRSEVCVLVRDSLSQIVTARDEAKQVEIVKTLSQKMLTLLSTSAHQQEQDFLNMHINSLSRMSKIQESSDRNKAFQVLFESLRTEQEKFIRNYLKSDQLRSLVLQIRSATQEKLALENQPGKITEQAANKAKTQELFKQMLAFYDNTDLDEQTRRELNALDELSIVPKFMFEDMRRFAYSKTDR